ncbi:unnamed protein product [Hermetia illucens]|uniref:Uncharacterized protein n=1 Tax=Hermetia illucens TaxID=343691 RepID=A0A7R8UM40_HERIL|nr:unnamed protein product [Hermetia illucens]
MLMSDEKNTGSLRYKKEQVDPENLKKVNCNNGLACATLNGVFNCSNGHCKNMSEFYLCHHKADGFTLDPDKDNTKLNGFFECSGARCTKIKNKFTCDRYCSKITTTAVNVLIIQDDSLITAECDTAVAFNEARGADAGVRIDPPKQFWAETDGILLTSCMGVVKDGDKIRASDCLNGTLLAQSTIPHPFMNFTQFWKIYEESDKILDPSQKFLPKQSTLTIYNFSRLYINLEGCVNTLRGECKEFVANYGKDGDNNTHVSRYQCYYNKHDSSFAVARYDLAKTYRELIIAISVPSVLFVISFISLCIITQSVKVGDDAKMRCKYCSDENSDLEDNLPKSSSKKQLQNLNNTNLSRGGGEDSDIYAGAAAAVSTEMVSM